MEDYKQKYEDAIERMKSWVRGEHPECFTDAQKAAEFIFPELKSTDDKMKDIIIEALSSNESQDKIEKHGINLIDCVEWLENGSEWSDYDKKIINVLIDVCDISEDDETWGHTNITTKDIVSWLKSIKPKSNWKPTQEQMEYLWMAQERNDYTGHVLNSLYRDLRKLTE